MDSSLGPVEVTYLINFHEKRWLDLFQLCDVLLYRRYVDDIICLLILNKMPMGFLKDGR